MFILFKNNCIKEKMKKKTSKDYVKLLKNDLDRGNNFIDYFTVIGLPTDLIFSDFLYENDLFKLNESGKLKPEILSKFPPFDKSTISIDENIIKHCFPNGYFLKDMPSQPPIECFGFVLDNNFYSISYPQKFISCLIFYESLDIYHKVYQKYKNFDEDTKDIYILDENKKIIRKSDRYFLSRLSYNTGNSKSSKSIEDDSKTEHKNIIDEDVVSVKSLRINLNNSKSKFKNLYAPKCICFASVYPFFMEFGRILKTIYMFSKVGRVKKPLEKIIESLIIEVPAPPRGIWKVEVELINEKYELKQPSMNKLPLLNLELEIIFIKFKIDQILEIYKHILLETRIIFFSKEISTLTPIIEGFLSLIYPLKYTFQHVTILPQDNFMILESVTPYIVGINQKYEDNFFNMFNIDIQDITYLIVDIDEKKVELKYPTLSNKISKKKYLSEEFPDLPKHYRSKLIDSLQIYIKELKSNQKKKEDRDNFVRNMREHFFQFIVNIFQEYSKYLNVSYYTNNDIGTPTIQNLFKVDEFLSSVAHIDRLFYKKMMETQMFVELIYKRMIPKDARDKIEILFFDEHIIEKNNRKLFSKKIFTPFLHSNVYDHKSVYPVHKTKSNVDFSYFKRLENIKEALKYGQEIILDNDEVSMNYHFFPLMMNHVYFKPEQRNFIIPSVLSEEVDQTNSEIIAKSYLGNLGVQFNEMDNSIYLCWIQLWSMTFWYHDTEEKHYRFQQMLIVLDKVKNHEMETFNLLFEAVSKYGEDYMVLKLYERLIHYRLNPNYLICTTVMRLIDKKTSSNSKQNNNQNILEYLKKNKFNEEWDVNQFKKRTFRTKMEQNILSNDVNFYLEDSCLECQNSINLNKLSRNFSEMRREPEWAICPSCNYYVLPKMGVRLGKELNKNKNLKFNTSIYDRVVLYSPLYLKINYNIALIKEFQLKLDIDNFRQRFNAIFWDSIWYFNLRDLSYDFFLPYEFEVNLADFNKKNAHLKIEKSGGDMNTAIREENEIQKKFFEKYPHANINVRDTVMTNHFDQMSKRKKLAICKSISFDILNEIPVKNLNLNNYASSKSEDNHLFEIKKNDGVNVSDSANFINTSLIQDVKNSARKDSSKDSSDSMLETKKKESIEDIVNQHLNPIVEETEYNTNNFPAILIVNSVEAEGQKDKEDIKENINEIVENKEYIIDKLRIENENEEILTTLHVNEDKINQIMDKLEKIDY